MVVACPLFSSRVFLDEDVAGLAEVINRTVEVVGELDLIRFEFGSLILLN